MGYALLFWYNNLLKLFDAFRLNPSKSKLTPLNIAFISFVSKGIKENKVEFINYLNLAYGEYVITPTQSVLSTLRKIGDSLIGSE